MWHSYCPKQRSLSIQACCSRVRARDGQADWCGVSSNAGVVPDRCVEEGAEPEGKAFNLPVCLLLSWDLGNDWKNEITDTSSSGWLDIRRAVGVEPMLLRIETRWFYVVIRTPPGHFPLDGLGASSRKPRGRLRTGLETPQAPSGVAGKCCVWEECDYLVFLSVDK